jgi:hypothetical protein
VVFGGGEGHPLLRSVHSGFEFRLDQGALYGGMYERGVLDLGWQL